MSKTLLKITEFTEQYNVSRSTTYRLFVSGQLTQIKIGRSTRISVKEAEEWLKNIIDNENDKGA